MSENFGSRPREAGKGSQTSELALGHSMWAPATAPLDVPRQTLERRSSAPAWLALTGRMTPRDA